MAGGQHLGHGRHPDEIAAEHADHPDLRRRLERRPEPGRVDALGQRLAEPRRGLVRERAQRRVVGGAHVREARPERVVVRPDERRCPLQVEVIRDEHEVARREVLADAAARIRDDERARRRAARAPAPRRRPGRRGGLRRGARAPSSPRPARRRTCRARACRRARARSRRASRGSRRTGSRPRPRPGRRTRRGPSPRTTAARGTSGVRSRIAATASSITPIPRRRGRRSARRRTRPPRPARR